LSNKDNFEFGSTELAEALILNVYDIVFYKFKIQN